MYMDNANIMFLYIRKKTQGNAAKRSVTLKQPSMLEENPVHHDPQATTVVDIKLYTSHGPEDMSPTESLQEGQSDTAPQSSESYGEENTV